MENIKQVVVVPKTSYERLALLPFQEVLRNHALLGSWGQGLKNRIRLEGNVYFQFGDLRVDTVSKHIVVEVESAGGVTYLAKYWYCLERDLIPPPEQLVLLHLFMRKSSGDYGSHIELWKFLKERMVNQYGDRFIAHLFTYHPDSLKADLAEAVKTFENLLKE